VKRTYRGSALTQFLLHTAHLIVMFYVANQFSNNVNVIDDETNEVTDTVSVGNRPVGVAHDPNNNRIYVTNSASDDVTIINGSTDQVIDTISSGGDTPATPVFSPINNFIYVTNQLSNNVAVIATSGGLPTPAVNS
jgi:YVTN family beta-propeller protein